MRSALVTALVARAESSLKPRVRRFLHGLSCDELQFIAAFLGTCILESATNGGTLDRGVSEFERRHGLAASGAEDRDLKMILLMEYLCRSGIGPSYCTMPPGFWGSSRISPNADSY